MKKAEGYSLEIKRKLERLDSQQGGKVIMGLAESCESAFPEVYSEDYYQVNGPCANNASLRF